MDIEKLIKRLKCPQIQSCPMDGENPSCKVCQKSIKQDAAAALFALQAENDKLREKIEDARLEGYAKGLGEMSEENEELRAELEQVKAERDAESGILSADETGGGGKK